MKIPLPPAFQPTNEILTLIESHTGLRTLIACFASRKQILLPPDAPDSHNPPHERC